MYDTSSSFHIAEAVCGGCDNPIPTLYCLQLARIVITDSRDPSPSEESTSYH